MRISQGGGERRPADRRRSSRPTGARYVRGSVSPGRARGRPGPHAGSLLVVFQPRPGVVPVCSRVSTTTPRDSPVIPRAYSPHRSKVRGGGAVATYAAQIIRSMNSYSCYEKDKESSHARLSGEVSDPLAPSSSIPPDPAAAS